MTKQLIEDKIVGETFIESMSEKILHKISAKWNFQQLF